MAYAEAGGVAESVVDGQTGVLVYGDDEDFTAAIESLITHRQQRETMGKDARAHAARFSWDASAERFEAVLAEAMATAASRGASSWIRRRRRAYRR